MTQQQLNRKVSAATGEDLYEIRRRGFSLADPLNVNFDPEPDDLPPSMIDWDEHDFHSRNVPLFEQPVGDYCRAGR
ncbi:MAG: hypothetical protein CMJ47_11925 [Planctomyces sp.]|nr:hypothetical protein [Planctomyces sp.]